MASSTVPASGGGLAPYYQKFVSSGTFTLPSGYGASKPLLVTIQVIGGGGGGVAHNIAAKSNLLRGYGNWTSYFGNGTTFPFYINGGQFNGTQTTTTGVVAGGSGGIAQTQLYLTSNLTITVGSAGTLNVIDGFTTTISSLVTNAAQGTYNSYGDQATGGTGGTTLAGSIKASGGVGASERGYISWGATTGDGSSTARTAAPSTYVVENQSNGTGGTPSGTTGNAVPLLGTLAGGSSSTTPVNGSFGIGGIAGDGGTSTGVEGTGGGAYSNGASGAVILTWWA